MSETGESDDGYQNLNCRRGRKRKIIMRIEFNDDDEASTDSDVSDSNLIRPTSHFPKRNPLKRAIISSDDSSSSEDEVSEKENGSDGKSKAKNQDEKVSEMKKSDDEFATDSSSDETLEKCPICLLSFRNQEIASPATCDHIFCFICLEEWAKNVKTCPIDRREFKTMIVKDSFLSKKFVREVNAEIEKACSAVVSEDMTYCEVCYQPNREDVMLLCDGCNQGYHMHCLSPPLSEIPEGRWFCDHCFEDDDDDEDDADEIQQVHEELREMGIPETRFRITEVRQQMVPRTRQAERVRARIFARAIDEHRTSENNNTQPSTSASTRAKRSKKKKSRRRRPARRRRRYVLEYDVDNYDEKFAIKERLLKKRKSRKRPRKTKRASCATRIINIPRDERPLLATPSFSLFGNPNDLEYFSDSDDALERPSGSGSTSVQAPIRLRNPNLLRRKEGLTGIEAPSPQVDVLSSIMGLQDLWHNMTRRNQLSSIRIGTNGTLLLQENAGSKEQHENKKNEPPINEAPLYPRSNNPNFSGGERYDGHSNNYRNNSGFRSSGNQYRHSTGSSGFNINSFRRDDNNGQFNRSLHHVFSNNIQISPSFTERIRNQQNQRPDRRNANQFQNNESSNGGQNNEQVDTVASNTPPAAELNIENNSIADIPIPQSVGGSGNNSSVVEDEPLNYSSSELNSSAATSVVPPLEPPPWNNNLFRLAGDYDDDDDDADCPNFSIYSAESLQVARSSKEENDDSNSKNPEKGQEDDFEEKEEDLVQLGDDDEIPDAIESGNKDTDSSDIYEPENPTDEIEEVAKDEDNECKEKTPENNTTELENETESDVPTAQANVKNNDDKPSDRSIINKKGVLELYDESDWDEWNIDKNKLMEQTCANAPSSEILENKEMTEQDESVQDQENIQTESISEEEDRSYTPCLDEKVEHEESIQNKDESHTPPKPEEKDKVDSDRGDISTTVIDGMETELISDEDEEILSQEQAGSTLKKKDKDDTTSKKPRKEAFKKISKSTKERNYRGDKERVKGKRARSRSRSNDKENRRDPKRNSRKRVRRKEIERYDVRNIIGQPRTYKDRYGRDTSRPRSRSHTRSRSRRRRSRSRSKIRSRSASSRRNRRSFSISPSPVSFLKSSSYRRSISSRRSRSRRSRSRRRSPIRRRSRTPLRMRSPSPRTNGRRKQKFRRRSQSVSSRSHSRSRSRIASPRRGRSTSLSRMKNKRKKSKDRKKKKTKKRSPSLSVSPAKRLSRPNEHRDIARKKKRPRTKSPIDHTSWSPTPPRPVIAENNDSSWTPPLASSNTGNLTVILKNKESAAEAKKKADKKKKKERRREAARKERRKQRSEVRESPIAPSKEVFASGDNILVSVSFNKEGNHPLAPPQQTTVVTLPPTREEIISKRRSAERGGRKQKRTRDKGQRRHKKSDAKPVAIIDLDRSPFQEIVQSPKDVIILTDSDQEVDEHGEFNSHGINMEIASLEQTNGNHQHDNIESANVERTETLQEESFESSSLQQLGPKTPPEPPVVKFSLSTKSKQIKARNPLHEEQEEVNNEPVEENVEEIEKSSANKIGPNTPPESGPCSPDAYDPFDPTKSPSMSPSPAPPAEISTPVHNEASPVEESREPRPQIVTAQEKNMNPVDLVMALINSKTNKSHEMCSINTDQQYAIPANEVSEIHEKGEDGIPKAITVLSNVLITPGKGQQKSSNLPTIASPVSKSSQSMGLAPQSIVSKLPLPRTSSTNRHSSGNDENINEIESPYSPGSDDYDDLFEPPPENCTTLHQLSQRARMHEKRNKGNKAVLFDNLFGNTSPIKIPSYTPTAMRKRGTKYKKTSVKVAKLPGGGKIEEDQIKIFDDLPSSAVELQVKDKFLRKLNRQERVVEEVKLVLKPHYNKKHISKEDYKEILRRAVPKICHSRSQDINPKKIQNLIEAYVKKFRQRNKLGILNTGQVSSAVKCAAYLKKL